MIVLDCIKLFLDVMKEGVDAGRTVKLQFKTPKGDYVNVIITAYNGETLVGTTKIALAVNGGFMTKWYTHPLSNLGKVTRLDFTMESNDNSDWGMKAPKYFAFDNVVIKK